MDRTALKQGGRYNWKNQPERLIYMGTKHYFGDRRTWHQFSLVGDDPETCWCEVLEAELLSFEETAQAAPGCKNPMCEAPNEGPCYHCEKAMGA